MNFKFVSSGQAGDDAAVVSQVIHGNSLKTLPPANLRGFRDTANNLRIVWTRRSRLVAGMLPNTDVPVGEEDENYDADILDGSNNVLRTIHVGSGGGPERAILIPTVLPQYTTTNNLLDATVAEVGASGSPAAYTQQRLFGSEAWIEATLVATKSDCAPSFVLIPPRVASEGFGTRILADFSSYTQTLVFNHPANASPGFSIYEGSINTAVLKYSSGSLGPVTTARVRVIVSNGKLRYFWDYAGAGSVPFYESARAPELPLVGAFLTFYPGAQVRDVHTGTSLNGDRSTTYSADAQTGDGLTPGNLVRVRVYQISALVGRGGYVQGDI